MKDLTECAEKLMEMSKALREMASEVDEILTKMEAGEDENKYSSDGDVEEGRIKVGRTPEDDVQSAVKIIKLSLGK
jgi:hypothetical protein